MAEEDQTEKWRGNVHGRLDSKKQKEKKIPQRGLGVAQLEKIRVEDLQKKDAIALASSMSQNQSSSNLSLLLPQNYHLSNQSTSSRTDLLMSMPMSESLFRPFLPAHKVDVKMPSSVQFPNSVNNDGFEVSGHVSNSHRLLDVLENDSSLRLDPGFALRSSLSLFNEANPFQAMVQGTQQYLQSSPYYLVNVPTPGSPFALSFQTEPPSNQSYYSNSLPLGPEDEKMVGMKRVYPFSLDNPTFSAPLRLREPASYRAESNFNFQLTNKKLREGPPSASTSISETNSKNIINDNGALDGSSLSLAPPSTTSSSTTTWTSPTPSSKSSLPSSAALHNRMTPDFERIPFQGFVNDPIWQPGPSRSSEQQLPPFNFFPPAKVQNGHTAASTTSHSSGEFSENIDLDLKL